MAYQNIAVYFEYIFFSLGTVAKPRKKRLNAHFKMILHEKLLAEKRKKQNLNNSVFIFYGTDIFSSCQKIHTIWLHLRKNIFFF